VVHSVRSGRGPSVSNGAGTATRWSLLLRGFVLGEQPRGLPSVLTHGSDPKPSAANGLAGARQEKRNDPWRTADPGCTLVPHPNQAFAMDEVLQRLREAPTDTYSVVSKQGRNGVSAPLVNCCLIKLSLAMHDCPGPMRYVVCPTSFHSSSTRSRGSGLQLVHRVHWGTVSGKHPFVSQRRSESCVPRH